MKIKKLLLFKNGKKYEDESFITPLNLFQVTKIFISTEVHSCKLSKIKTKSKHFLNKFRKLTNNGFNFKIT